MGNEMSTSRTCGIPSPEEVNQAKLAISSWKQKFLDADARAQSLEKDLAAAQERIQALLSDAEEARTQLTEARAQLTQKEEELRVSEVHSKELADAVAGLTKKVTESRSMVQQLSQKYNEPQLAKFASEPLVSIEAGVAALKSYRSEHHDPVEDNAEDVSPGAEPGSTPSAGADEKSLLEDEFKKEEDALAATFAQDAKQELEKSGSPNAELEAKTPKVTAKKGRTDAISCSLCYEPWVLGAVSVPSAGFDDGSVVPGCGVYMTTLFAARPVVALKDLYAVKITLLHANNLSLPPKKTGKAHRDAYVTMKVGKQTKKTAVAKATEDPVWNESFTFILETKPEFTTISVWDYDQGRDDAVDKCGDAELQLPVLFASDSGLFEGDLKLDHASSGSINVHVRARVVPQATFRWGGGYQHKHERVADLISHAQADINRLERHGRTPLMNSVIRQQPDACHALILAQADPNVVDQPNKLTALHYAAIYGGTEVAEVLVAAQANVEATDNDKRTPLFFAIKNNHPKVFQFLLQSKAQVNAIDNDGVSPLMLAAHHNYAEFAKVLLEHGAEANVANKNGLTPLMICAVRSHVDVARVLLKAPTLDCELRDNNGLSAFMISVVRGSSGMAELLLEHKADIDAQEKHGRTALMFAAHTRKTAVVAMLLQHGANKDIVDKDGMTATSIAEKSKDKSILALLQ